MASGLLKNISILTQASPILSISTSREHMSKKFQVFVSSTYQDLRDERDQVIKAILEMGHIPVGMEMFSAADDEQWQIIARQIDEIDYYVIVVAHRYGSVTLEGVGYTEKEFDYAVAKGVPILGFVIDDTAPWPNDRSEDDAKSQKRLAAFKKKIKGRLIQFWKTKEDLHGRVSISLMKTITAHPRTGWVRANEISGPEVMNELTRLSSENASLRNDIEALRRITEGQKDEVRTIVKILANNTRKFGIRKTGKWADATKHTLSLADVFSYCAPNLISENSSQGFAQNIALKVIGAGYFKEWPVGSNNVSDMIADLAALDLVEPSDRKSVV